MSTQTNDILERIKNQYEKNKPKQKKEKFTKEQLEQYLKKYFNVVKEGDYTFRILPAKDNESPFVESYFHHLKVNGKWTKLYCPRKNDEKDCPICEAEDALRATGKQEDFDLSRNYQAKLFYIVKGIDRNNVEDGVKFWRFKHNYKQQGVYDKILPVFAKKGDITDPVNGRDLIITATKTTGTNNITYVTISSVMPDDVSKLVEDDKLLKELVNEKTTWKDIFKAKETEYLQAVVEGRAPYWDESAKKYVRPGGKKKTTVVPETNGDDDGTSSVSFENVNDNSEESEETPEAVITPTEKVKKISKKLKKQTVVEDIFDDNTTNGNDDEEDSDLPF